MQYEINFKNKIFKKTKIIATIGPSSNTYEKLLTLISNGVNIFRFNFSHGDDNSHLQYIKIIHDITKKTGIYIPILLDTKGPEIRIGQIKNDNILIKKNDKFRISMNNKIIGTEKIISVTYDGLYNDAKIGDHLKIDDGNLDLIVIEKEEKKKELIVIATNEHLLKSNKSIKIPNAKISMNFITEKDKKDLAFGCKHNVDFIAASFTSNENNILDIKKILKKFNKPDIPIIAKIENIDGIKNIDKILNVADGIMIARGDLGIELPLEFVPFYQEMIIKKCRALGKPVIVATQMLDSMQSHLYPTRAEVSDVYVAVKESADAIMLSAETATGLYPSEAVDMQKKIASTVEPLLNYKELAKIAYDTSDKNDNDAIANSITNAALLINAKLIIVFSQTGKIAQRISKTRPYCPIIFVSDDKNTILKNEIYWGVYGILTKKIPDNMKNMDELALKIAKNAEIKINEPIIIVSGIPEINKTNIMRIIYVK